MIQSTFDETSEDYKAFVEKFKPKKTTDDCYTPANIYDAVLEWAAKKYGFDKSAAVRPFWPTRGGGTRGGGTRGGQSMEAITS